MHASSERFDTRRSRFRTRRNVCGRRPSAADDRRLRVPLEQRRLERFYDFGPRTLGSFGLGELDALPHLEFFE